MPSRLPSCFRSFWIANSIYLLIIQKLVTTIPDMRYERGVREVVNIDADELVRDYFNVEYARSAIVDGVDICRTTAATIYDSPEAALKSIKADKAFSRFLFDFNAGVNGAALGVGSFAAVDGFTRALTGDEVSAIIGLAEFVAGLNVTTNGVLGVFRDWVRNANLDLRENINRRSVEEKAIKAYLQQKSPKE